MEHNNKILVVDDSEIIRDLLFIVLSGEYDCEVDIACDGKESIEMVKRHGIYKLILMDFQMKHMNGSTTTEILRKEMDYKGIILGLTCHADAESKIKGMEAGMNICLDKPIDVELLKNIINGLGIM